MTMTSLSLNVGNFITLKLSPTNYPLWREQALALAESQELLGHLTNEDPAHPNTPYQISIIPQLQKRLHQERQKHTSHGEKPIVFFEVDNWNTL